MNAINDKFEKRHFMRWLLLFFISLIPSALHSQEMTVYADYAQFQVPGGETYVEVYLKIPAPHLKFVQKKDTGWQATLEVIMVVMQGNKTVYADKYDLLSPGVNEFFRDFNLVDLKRVALKPGNYQLSIEVKDLNSSAPAIPVDKNIEVLVPLTPPAFSDVVLADTILMYNVPHPLMKHNLLIFPLVHEGYNQEKQQGFFYTEIYPDPSATDSIYLLNYYLKSGGKILEGYSSKKAIRGSEVVIANGAFPLQDLAPGQYRLVLELQNIHGNILVVQEKKFSLTKLEVFEYHKPTLEELKVLGYVLIPKWEKEKYQEAKQLLANQDSTKLEQLLMKEWTIQLEHPPHSEWNQFFERLEYVNERFRTSLEEGYLTDRGRVYLRYGPPNSVSLYPDEPTAYPYEIWHYYQLENQSNKRFIFYNPTQLPEDFVLLHSDALGEQNNPQWRKMIYSRTNKDTDLYDKGKSNNYGSYLDRFWNE